MEKEKYYTPKLEEFHVGFEFEFNGIDNNWRQLGFSKEKVLNSNEFNMYTLSWVDKVFKSEDVIKEHLRVKYLDLEDIESLGWELICPAKSKNSCSLYQWNKAYDYEGSDLEIKWHISHYSDNKLIIHNNQYYDSEVVIFSGNIKNKSELKFIMNSLGII